ncbi:MAG TPA: hypothetical protein VJ765_13085 [Chitinophagaceae bacterium]|nr:hypothetical protein [Chitinophagaceae bacterium]
MLGSLKGKFVGWSFMRILRFIMGTAGLIFAIRNHDMLLGVAGGFLLLMAVFNFGCCAVNACNVPTRNTKMKTNVKEPQNISNEEVV